MNRVPWRSETGAATVEFALVAFWFFLIVFGIIEFGILIFDQHVLTHASREGARAGIVMRVPRVTDQEIKQVVEELSKDHMVFFGPSSTLSTTVTPPEASRTGPLFGTELVVTVTYPFEFLFLSSIGIGPITLEAETRMLME